MHTSPKCSPNTGMAASRFLSEVLFSFDVIARGKRQKAIDGVAFNLHTHANDMLAKHLQNAKGATFYCEYTVTDTCSIISDHLFSGIAIFSMANESFFRRYYYEISHSVNAQKQIAENEKFSDNLISTKQFKWKKVIGSLK